MVSPNPYYPPQAAVGPESSLGSAAAHGTEYISLRWRTLTASIALVATVGASVAMHVTQLVLGPLSKSDLTPTLIVGAFAMLVLGTAIACWVFVPVWIYRAAANLPGLGRTGMAFTPGWCIGWFFIPIANLWKPPQAMSEIWRASDPEGEAASWMLSVSRTPLIAVWWGAYLLSSVLSWGPVLNLGNATSEGTAGLLVDVFRAIAAVTLILLMRSVADRQERAAQKLDGGI